MRGIWSGLALGQMGRVVLLGLGTIAMVIPSSDEAFSQRSAGTVEQATLFTAIEITPGGFADSQGITSRKLPWGCLRQQKTAS